MISILSRNLFSVLLLCVVIWATLFSLVVAQSSQTLSVSPTLLDITAERGQTWQSELRIVNPNDYDLVVYPQVVNFSASGESGQPRFQEIIEEETAGQTLGEWIEVGVGPINVPEQQAITIPFSVAVPPDAVPGGHYAAILIGTRPPDTEGGGSGVQTSQFVTALLFLRVDGDVIETARIRDFATDRNVYQTSEVDLSLRFENTGNVHVQPQGDITITNMWGEKRGTIPVNQRTQFGKVLRDSTREFSFAWKGDGAFFDIGRYKAEVTLAFGESNKQFVTSQTYFWVIPVTSILLVLGSIGIFVTLVVMGVRMYVRRMLILAGVNPDTAQRHTRPQPGTIVIGRYQRVTAPFRSSIADIKQEVTRAHNSLERVRVFLNKIWQDYWRICLGVLIFIVTCAILLSFRWAVTQESREYEVTIYNSDSSTRTLSSEEIIYESLPVLEPVYVREINDSEEVVTVQVVNVSGELGQGAALARQLESYDLSVTSVTSDFTQKNNRSVILYQPAYEAIALAISRELGGVLVSARTTDDKDKMIEIRVGADMLK